MNTRKTIAILGGGSAGFTAARTAARCGARVALFMGDDADAASLCVNRGCMPSKALFGPIDAMHHAKRLGLLDVLPRDPERYLAQLVAWKDREIARFRAFRQRAIREREAEDFVVVRRAARFENAHTVTSGGQSWRVDAAVIATGSRPRIPSIDGLAELRRQVWTSDEILENTVLPASLIVVGAGAIGLEFALRYARLGCAVTVLARSRFLSGWPEAFGSRLAGIYEREGVRVLTDTRPSRIGRDAEGRFVVETGGPSGSMRLVAERVLLAAGRVPMIEGVGLEAAGVEGAREGRMSVGPDLRLAGAPHLFAAGDVTGRRMVVHEAHFEAGVAATNAATDGSKTRRPASGLQVVFSDPEFAFAGLTEEAAAAAGIETVTEEKPSRLVGKLHLAGDDDGFGRLIADARTHRLIGAGLLCHGASDLIHLPSFMIERGHTVHDGAMAEYYHPTRMEIVSSMLDRLCERLGEPHPGRADEKTG